MSEKGVTVVSGNITKTSSVLDEQMEPHREGDMEESDVVLEDKDIYKELRLRGYNYR